MSVYNFRLIEKKWQEYWSKNNTFKVEVDSSKPKFYVLDMFPYPSGAGLHVGHPISYIASDIYARYKRHKGFNVLHPQGYDSFGLPTEQYAILTGQHPEKTTKININRYRNQLDKMGFSYDWSREIRTSDTDYYKWTQWMFILLFNSCYDLNLDRAVNINKLVKIFKSQGNENINFYCEENILKFTSKDWDSFSKQKKEEILQKYRLAFISNTEVNWCEKLGTVLANDEIVNGVSERGGFEVTKKKMEQWSIRIGAYAERLLSGLKKIEWSDSIKDIQKNWIGKSTGYSLSFKIYNSKSELQVYTTRPDTIFGVSFLAVSPDHELISQLTIDKYKKNVDSFVKSFKLKSERDILTKINNSSGIFTGSYAIHPLTGNKIQIWIADYVLSSYGYGAVMCVPCGDERDFKFAKKYKINIINIFKNINISTKPHTLKIYDELINSDFLNGLNYEEANQKIGLKLEKNNIGFKNVKYKIRDSVFSRQRYWGEPIPIYFKNGIPHSLKKDDLPLKLPVIKNFLPTPEGYPPLGNAKIWAWDEKKRIVVDKKYIDNINIFPLELSTMPGWAGSSWYFNRYMDPKNKLNFVGSRELNYWKEVDLYIGGIEHASGHLLYSRFWQKFLYDFNLVPTDEYAKKLVNQGMILGNSAFIFRTSKTNTYISKNLVKDNQYERVRVDISLVNENDELDIEKLKEWLPEYKDANFKLENGKYIVAREIEKMSKSKFNVINPDDICKKYGADTLRLYEMFLGPIEQSKPWSMSSISGVHNFLKKTWKLFHLRDNFEISKNDPSVNSLKSLNKAIKKVNEDIQKLSFNTCISSLMICVNELLDQKCNSLVILKPLLILISPFAPHFSEELWSLIGSKSTIANEKFPDHDDSYLIELTKNYPISFNGKLRFKKELSMDLSNESIEKIIMSDKKTNFYLKGQKPKKIIIIKGKIINIVV